MRSWHMAAFVIMLGLIGCESRTPSRIAVIADSQLRLVTTEERLTTDILAQAGVVLGPGDALLYNGFPVGQDSQLPGAGSGTLQVRRAEAASVNGKSFRTAARTIGEALSAAGMELNAADSIMPLANTSVTPAIKIEYLPARELQVRADGQVSRILSAAPTAGAALASAGFPLLGLDYSKPGENEPVPANGQIQVVRVSESLMFAEKAIPFQSEFRQSAHVELGQDQITQPGLEGLAVSRVRIRYEDGQEVSRQAESETVVRPPQNRITLQGTKVVVKTATVDGRTIQYWRQMQMYATTYSPCNSGTGSCSTGTASGLRAGKGVVAVDPALYAYLNGQHLYIPGYGPAVIGDIGGGYLVEQSTGVSRYRWIDLGFDDNNIADMTGWVTVYFLAPAPATIPDILK